MNMQHPEAGVGSTDAADPTPPVKISCRHVWKVYGPGTETCLPDRTGIVDDVPATLERLRGQGCIPAAVDVSFDVPTGGIFVIMGLSGSGKSTMVRCLSRLVEPTAGSVMLDDLDLLGCTEAELIEIRRHRMGMVFQNFGLMPHLSVLENVAFPLRVQGIPEKQRFEKAAEMIALVGLEGREGAFPRQLSGGQRQRVGIARSLAVNPEIWFLDEPFSALDPLIRRQMQDEFVSLQKTLHKTIVFITHDFLEALKIADRIAIMKDGQVVQQGTAADLVLHPANAYVHEFTDDVPLVRVITVGDVCEPPEADLDPADGVRDTATLEEILPAFAGRRKPLPVLDGDGKVIGAVTAQGVVQALAESEKRLEG